MKNETYDVVTSLLGIERMRSDTSASAEQIISLIRVIKALPDFPQRGTLIQKVHAGYEETHPWHGYATPRLLLSEEELNVLAEQISRTFGTFELREN